MDNKGRIVQVLGPVVDVEFEDGNLPYIKDALEVDNNGKKCVMEVAQHIGNNTVRCIMSIMKMSGMVLNSMLRQNSLQSILSKTT